ncbi:MAG: sugar transferase [bacterium]|nr:sugar transferase [bacterium]
MKIPTLIAIPHPTISLKKRVFDLLCISLASLLLIPLMILIALSIKVVSKGRGPIFFKQERIGYKGKRFILWKFRSMQVGASTLVHEKHITHAMASNLPLSKLDENDPRLIPLGGLLRSSGLDELPQIINILRGEMSLVGPRPCLPSEHALYLPRHKRRYNSLPGVTGFWQVNGKNKTTFREMIAMDLWYAKNKSVTLDVWIMYRTIPTVSLLMLETLSRVNWTSTIWSATNRTSTVMNSSLRSKVNAN